MKASDEIEDMHLFVVKVVEELISTEDTRPMLIVNCSRDDCSIIDLADWFVDDERKVFVAEAMKSILADVKPTNAVLVTEAVVGLPEPGEKYESAADCNVHYDVVQIQIEVAGAVHLWAHRLEGEKPNRSMDLQGNYHRHGPEDWGRFVLMPENQEDGSCAN